MKYWVELRTTLYFWTKPPWTSLPTPYTTQNIKFSMKNFSSNCDQIRIWLLLLKKSFMKIFIFVQCLGAGKWKGEILKQSKRNGLTHNKVTSFKYNSPWRLNLESYMMICKSGSRRLWNPYKSDKNCVKNVLLALTKDSNGIYLGQCNTRKTLYCLLK